MFSLIVIFDYEFLSYNKQDKTICINGLTSGKLRLESMKKYIKHSNKKIWPELIRDRVHIEH